MPYPLADALGGAHETAGTEGALMQTLDCGRVFGLFGQDRDGEVGHEGGRELAFEPRAVHCRARDDD